VLADIILSGAGPVLTHHHAMLQRKLLYTGVTRGKRLVVLVGQKKAVATAVRNTSGHRRWSKLGEWLRGATNRFSSRLRWMTATQSGCYAC
jgi:exodeoxyribonuclease V alpha subunit